MVAVTTTILINEIDKILPKKVVLSLLKITVTGISNEIFVLYHPKIQDEDPYESIATVGEIQVWWRADFQSGSRVLKKVF